ncbi:MAG: DUF1559 domain-containing protein [Planctomycetaceae bacterium]|nr:DUF1559 domain-containing protein [Planctomycetaceae bacterium]
MSAPYMNAPMPHVAHPNKKSNVLMIVLIILGVLFLVAVCVIGLLIALLLPAVQQARLAARHVHTENTARQIGLALLNYDMMRGELPAAATTDGNSQPLFSWRVEVLPYLEQLPLYDRWSKDQSWNSSANAPISNMHVAVFSTPLCPDSDGTNRTAFVAVVGPDTVINTNGPRKMRSIQDGVSNTAMLLELRASDIAWAEPRDVSVEEAVRLIKNCPDSRGLTVVFADGSVSKIEPSVPEDVIVKMFNCSDGSASVF